MAPPRDSDEIAELGVPVYCRGTSPAGPHKGWGGRVNVPISCGGMIIQPGDVIVGDHDGVVVVPRSMAAATLQAAARKSSSNSNGSSQSATARIRPTFWASWTRPGALGIEII